MKKMAWSLGVFHFLCSVCCAQLKVPYFGQIQWVNGYAKEISGENIGYFSAFPDYATAALLTRCTDGNKKIEWETEPVPKKIQGPYIFFSWVAAHSSGTSHDRRNFDFYVNDQKILTFTTYPKNQLPNWTFGAADSSRIVFQQTRTDASDDSHGLVFLRLPVAKLKPGYPVKLKVVGQAQASNDWYMTFKFSFQEKVDVAPMPFVLKSGKQSLLLTALHFGNEKQLKVIINKKATYLFAAKNGMNSYDIPVDAVQKEDSVFVEAAIGSKKLIQKYFAIKPVVFRKIYFIHHSHTDIGYSHLQPDVLRIHMKNIDDALRMIDATKSFSGEAKFKWNIESLWVVENYLKQATQQQRVKFIEAVKGGNICLSGLYANILTGISEPEEVFHYTDFAEQLRKLYGVKIESAMISDIPGYAWTTVTGLAKGGIKYLSSGPNYLGPSHPYLGDRVGYFVKAWGDKPVWWISPSGEEKILFWTAGKGYSSWHGTPAGGVFDNGAKKIASYMNELEEQQYPYDMVQWRYNIVSDNGPLDTTISDFVEQWNKKYKSPEIILSTTQQLFETFEKKYGNQIPVVKGDITPYWEDGAFSTAYEEGKNRNNSLRLQQLSTLCSILDPVKYNVASFYNAWQNILLFHEHTWGAFNSTSEPDLPFVTKQWQIKRQFMLDADSAINRIEKDLIEPMTDKRSSRIIVVNSSSWIRKGPVTVALAGAPQSVTDAQGKSLPLQKLSNGKFMFMAENVPPLGASFYTVSAEKSNIIQTEFIISDTAVSNAKINLQWDRNGSIVKLTDSTRYNYAGSFNGQGINSYWYVPGLDPSKAVTNNPVTINVLENGPVVTTVAMISDAPGCNKLERRISLYAGSDEIFIENIIDKKSVREKESVHFGFPLNNSFISTMLDAGYGSMKYLSDQLQGSNMDFVYTRRWLDASNGDKGIQLLLLETPLIEPSSMINESKTVNQAHKEWKTEGKPTAIWFSYVMNNYWHTNYKADQDGVSSYHYALKPHGVFNPSQTEETAIDFTQPLMAFPVKDSVTSKNGLFTLTNSDLVVTSIVPQDEKRFMVRIYNPQPFKIRTGFQWKALKPSKLINLNTGELIVNNNLVLNNMSVMELQIIQ